MAKPRGKLEKITQNIDLSKTEMSPTQSIKYVQGLLKNKKNFKNTDFIPGKILMYMYNAKDKEMTYDRTPLVLVLKRNNSHSLCVNLHWAPMPLRVVLVKKIISLNKRNIKENRPLQFDYGQLKPFLKRIGFAPVIRLYINKRISSSGVVVPPDQFMNIARTKTETFTKGKYSAEELYLKALKGNKKYRATRKRRE